MNIKQKFLELTSETYPHGTESDLFKFLPTNLNTDEFGNLYIQIGDSPSTMFTSHLDTASSTKTKVNHVFDGNIIRTDGTSILGADDKAGVTIMLYMIENNINGLYYFFLGEERGCIGSKKVAQSHYNSPLPNIKKVVSFDRRGNNSVITFQSSQRCCSEDFATALSAELNNKSKTELSIDLEFEFQKDPTGIYTDSYQFISVYPECTNISVGYLNEHTVRESQDILFLEKLCKTVVMIDWEGLPVERNPKIEEFEDYYTRPQMTWYGGKGTQSNTEKTKKIWFIDKDFNDYISFIEVDQQYKVVNLDISPNRILEETKNIKETFNSFELDYCGIEWDGINLTIHYDEHRSAIHTRDEIENHIDELKFWFKYIK